MPRQHENQEKSNKQMQEEQQGNARVLMFLFTGVRIHAL